MSVFYHGNKKIKAGAAQRKDVFASKHPYNS
jgi:hypothetical protein